MASLLTAREHGTLAVVSVSCRDTVPRDAYDPIVVVHRRLRGVPADLPFGFDEASLRIGLNFTLDTDLGPLDLFGEVPGLGAFEPRRSRSHPS